MPTIFDGLDSPLFGESLDNASGGFVNETALHLLKPTEAGRLLNIDVTVAGHLQKSLGFEPLGSAGPGNPNGLHAFENDTLGLNVLVGQWGTSLFSSVGNDVWTPRATGAVLLNTPYMGVQGRGRSSMQTLFMTSCVAVTDNVSLPYGKITLLDSGFGVTQLDTQCKALAWFQARLWAFNQGASGPDILSWSRPMDGGDFSNGQNIQIEPDSGDSGVAIVPMRDATPRMLLFKERSIHMLELYWATDGYFPTTANALDFTKSLLRPITLHAGMVSTRGGVWAPGAGGAADYLFLSREGIRSLNRSQNDSQAGAGPPISKRIQTTIDRINWQEAHRSTASFFDNIAYFSVPVDGAVRNNLVIAHDVLRGGFYERDIQAAAWAPCKIQANRSHFFMSSSPVTEAYAASGATYGYHVYQMDAGLNGPAGAPISLDVQTRAFTFGEDGQAETGMRHKKKWNYLNIGIQSAVTHATLQLQYKVDDDDAWTILDNVYIDPTAAYPYLPLQLPFSFSTGRVVRRSRSLRHIRPGYSLQIRVMDTTSYARLKIASLQVYANGINPQFAKGPG